MLIRILQSVAVVLLVSLASTAFAQDYYVVIGAYGVRSYADKFTGYARSKFFDAQQGKHVKRNLLYIYTLKTSNKKEADEKAKFFRSETEFTDAWVYHGLLEHEVAPVKAPAVVKKVEPAEVVVVEEVLKPEPPKDPTPVVETPETPAAPIEEKPEPTLVESEPEVLAKPRGKYFKFVIKSTNGTEIPGDVHYVDRRIGREIAAFKSNTYVDIPKPAGDQPINIVCGIFGYDAVDKIIDYSDPSTVEGAYQDSKGVWVIPFEIDLLKKGDASVMYHVSFYKDAVIMLPESKEELEQLVSWMLLNPAYQIKVHAHCNGRANRKIITLGSEKNFFENKGSEEKVGTAKELTTLRAEAIKMYLVDNGVQPERIKTFSWGANDMLVAETSSSAPRLNDRIEIEILGD